MDSRPEVRRRSRESPEEFGPLIDSWEYILPAPTARNFAEEAPRLARMPDGSITPYIVKMQPARPAWNRQVYEIL